MGTSGTADARGIVGTADWAPAARVRDMGTSIFTEMTELARRTGAVNLGQGVPELGSPADLAQGRRRSGDFG